MTPPPLPQPVSHEILDAAVNAARMMGRDERFIAALESQRITREAIVCEAFRRMREQL